MSLLFFALFCRLKSLLVPKPSGAIAALKSEQDRPPEQHPIIPARCRSDDGRYEAHFDAVKWFAQADHVAIVELAAIGFGGDYPADAVAFYMADYDTELAYLFDHLHMVGFECHVDAEAAQTWLCINRPLLAAALDGRAEAAPHAAT